MSFYSEEEANRIFENIISILIEMRENFVDDSFRPCVKSLFFDENQANKNSIKWLRPDEIKSELRKTNWTIFRMPNYLDVIQGNLGNCWLLSGLSVIIEQPELLKKIIISNEFSRQGCYQVRLCKNGEWQTVILDDLFPCDQNGYLIYSQSKRQQLWVLLIEKALAKLSGCYESLIGGESDEGMSILTGFPSYSFCLESSSTEDTDLDLIWTRISSLKEAGYILTADTQDSNNESVKQRALESDHTYSVVRLQLINGNHCIFVRNPWGFNETTEAQKRVFMKLRLKNEITEDKGIIKLKFVDFLKCFTRIHYCKLRNGLVEKRISGYFSSEGTREMLAFTLIVFETCEIDIGLFHKTVKNRKETGDLDLCFVVLKSNGRKDSVGKLVTCSKRSVRRFIGCEHIFEPGEYLIVPCSFNFWYSREALETNNNLYNLVIHSTKVFYLEQEMHSAFLLADTIIQLVTTLGSKTSSGLDNACIYTLAKGYSGIMIVAENLNENSYLHVELDCERSNNVVSTRQSLLTKDSVPPLHRQVLIVLTQLEGSNSYSIQYSIKYRLSSNPYLNTWPGNEGRMVTNLPPISKQTFGLHVPRSVFN